MPRKRRDVPWLDWREGYAYVFWYDAAAGRTRRKALGTRDPGEAAKRFGHFLVAGPDAGFDRAAGLTVRQALARYLREHVEARDDQGRPLVTDQERQRTIAAHLTAYFGDDKLAGIGPAESRCYAEARRNGTIGGGKRRPDGRGRDSTIRRELTTLVAAANHAIKWGRLSRADAPRVELPSAEGGGDVKWLTKAQLRTVLAAASGPLQDFILIAYYTGARRRAIQNLTRFQVDLANGRINLLPTGARATKKRKPIVPIYDKIRPAIERLMADGRERLFSQDFYRPFVALLHSLGMEGHPHMLRHSRATHMLMDGEDIYKVARLLGDTVATVERVYGHHDPDYLRTDSGMKEA